MSKTKEEESHPIFSLILVLLFVPNIIFRGWISKTLWLWFLVPIGLPPIGTAQALGICLTLSWVTGVASLKTVISPDPADELQEKVGKLALGWLIPLAVLGMAWVYTKFL